jgi:hypothetical protein
MVDDSLSFQHEASAHTVFRDHTDSDSRRCEAHPASSRLLIVTLPLAPTSSLPSPLLLSAMLFTHQMALALAKVPLDTDK